MPRCGVLGWPVGHSRSPAMHEAAYRAAGLDGWRYQLLPVPPELLAETARALGPAGFAGANVTIPHKEAALVLADEATATARSIGAANTLTFEDGRIEADNTDAAGLLTALPLSPAARSALVIGAGGSARAAVWALAQAGAAEVLVWNRTAARAELVARDLGARAVAQPAPADLLVSCVPAGAAPRLDPANYGCVVDLAYGAEEPPLTAAARAAGIPVVGGLDVLVHQGALSFERWTGRAAPLEVMREAAGDG
jgi:shikimate dehydrogenase